jgi:hypothetical protein
MLALDGEALRNRLASEIDVRLAVLYGSRARGDERPDSDVDLLMVIEGGSVWRGMELEGVLEAELGPAGADRPSGQPPQGAGIPRRRDRGRASPSRPRWKVAQAAIAADADLHKRAQAAIAELTADAR